MAILKTHTADGGSLAKKVSLVMLTFQNSAFILIMHYSRIMPPEGDHRYFTSTAVFLNELIKLAVSLTLAMYETSKTLAPTTPATVLFEQIYNGVFSGDGWKLTVPAVFYTLQNLLQYVAIGNLDAVQFQVLYQLKILTTALFSVALLHRPLTPKRWLALIVLTLGVGIVSIPSPASLPGLFLHDATDHFFPRSMHELGQASAELFTEAPAEHLAKRSATYEGIETDMGFAPQEPLMNYGLGVTAVLVAAAVSGLTGVYFEKLLKESPSQASLWVRNVQLSFYSLIAAFFGGVVWQDGAGIREHGFFEGYNWVVWTAVGLQAAGGLLASLVIRDADNIVKNFATSISIVVSFLASVFIFEFAVTPTFLVGTSLVLLSTYLYNGPDRNLPGQRPPPVTIASFEKPYITSLLTPNLTPKLGATPGASDPSMLNLNPFDVKGVGMSSGRPNSPMVSRSSSKVDVRHED